MILWKSIEVKLADNFTYNDAEFDKPYSFIKMFDAKTKITIPQTIKNNKNNALQVAARQ